MYTSRYVAKRFPVLEKAIVFVVDCERTVGGRGEANERQQKSDLEHSERASAR